jgi:hypothetical protein
VYVLLTIASAWNLKTLEIDWRIRPRSCKMYGLFWCLLAFIRSSLRPRGYSAVSPNERTLAVTNLYDGIDWYSLTSNHFTNASFQHTTTYPTPENAILPITFVHGGSAVLSGTSSGCARITSSKDWKLVEKFLHERRWLIYSNMPRLRVLQTAEDIVQAIVRVH